MATGIDSLSLAAYRSEALHSPFTAKDVRTRGASSLVTGELGRAREEDDVEQRLRRAMDLAADRLGNTRAVCRDSYVHTTVMEANEDGRLADLWPRTRSGKWLSRDESALRTLLKEGS